ncbi:MAG: D-alanyl-D-alanine carboxypeptidase/D-alanyl-D-alanine-endopeptidase [Gemmatimonadota bacterium]|nr:D-alanyl-D-alanine carboxypeptidase/D-alanyl-D-alanine-endopeptidase [Gemmatimonadota bacterium]
MAPILVSPALLTAQSPQPGDRSAASRISSEITSPEVLAERIDRILADPALARAHVGLTVQVAETGEVLYTRNGEKRFTPASNVKLITGAVGLTVLGPEYRWKTQLVADGPIEQGTLEGNLWIVGGGDPALERDELRSWVKHLRMAGIQRIRGDVIGDDRRFSEPQWGRGWMWDDLYTGWSAGVSGLQLAPNTIGAAIISGVDLGDSTRLVLRSDGPPLPIRNRVLTGAPGSEVRLQFVPPAAGGDVELRGWVPLDPDSVRLYLATSHPTLYLLDWVEHLLYVGDILVEGEIRRARHDEILTERYWSHETLSGPFSTLLGDMLKPSDNQMAETILRTIGIEQGGEGSPEAGLAVVESTLADWGIEPGAMELSDGSGLSRYNEVTPNAIARMLRAVWHHPDFETFFRGLPVAGVDGTMRSRLVATPAFDNAHAKTGSMSGVRAVSGYLLDGSGETLLFSLLLNGYDTPGSVAVALEDLLIEQVALYRRPIEPGWPELRPVP